MDSKLGFANPIPNHTAYFPSPPGMQYSSQGFPQYGAPPPYSSSLTANVPQMLPHDPPPPYYPPTNSNDSIPSQATLSPYQTLPQHPFFEVPLHYQQQQQQYYHPNPNQLNQGGNPCTSPIGRASDYTPSCPLLSDDGNVCLTLSQGHTQTEFLGRSSSIGFGDVNENHVPGTLYPSLSETFRSSDPPPKGNVMQGATPLPPNLVLLWEGSKPVKLFFVQRDGNVVSPERPLSLCVYKCSPMNDVSSLPVGCLAGKALDATVLMKAEETWRLGLAKHRSYVVKGLQEEFAFYDDSTSPARFVIAILPKEINADERRRLNVLLMASSFMTDEPSNIVDKLDSGVETVFDFLTESVNSVVKKGTPDLHKSTKWLRKGTGQVVRYGGGLVSKGLHLVSDTVMEKETPKALSPQHSEIFEGLTVYRNAVSKNEVTKVSAPH